jgi:hypothetical protein
LNGKERIEQVLAAADAVKQQGLDEARSVMQDASEAVSALDATLDGLRTATAASLPLLGGCSKILRALAGVGGGDWHAALLRKSAAHVLARCDAYVGATAASADTLALALAEGDMRATALYPQHALPPLVELHTLRTALATRHALLSATSEKSDPVELAVAEAQLSAALGRVDTAVNRAVQEHWEPATFLQLRAAAAGGEGGELAKYCEQLATPLAECLKDAALTAAVDACKEGLQAASAVDVGAVPHLAELLGYVEAARSLVEQLHECARRCSARLRSTVVRMQQEVLKTAFDDGGGDSDPQVQWEEMHALLTALGAAVCETGGTRSKSRES